MTKTYHEINERFASRPTVDIEIFKPAKALNFSEAQNLGIEKAKNAYFLAISNDATIMLPNTLRTSLSLLVSDPSIGVVGHKIIQSDGFLNHFGLYVTFQDNETDHFGRGRDPNLPRFNELINVLAVMGACMLFKIGTYRFDTTYWFEIEDIDFCFQNIVDGKRIVVNPFCPVLHDEKTTRGEKKFLEIVRKKQEKGRT